MKDKKELFEQFHDHQDLFDEKPKDQLWHKLEQRLDQKRNVKKLKFYRLLAFAAMFTVIIAAVSYFNHYLTDHNPNYYVSNEGFTAYSLEDLENDESFFDTSNLLEIREAYKATNTQDNLIGEYESIVDKIRLSIKIENYSYFLIVNSNVDEVFSFSEMANNSLKFESKDLNRINLNITDSGLKVTESNFLPSGQDLEFRKLESI